MRLFVLLVICSGLFCASCKSNKKNQASPVVTSAPTPPAAPVPPSPPPLPVPDPNRINGTYEPGEAELIAAQKLKPEATMAMLQEGYYVYNKGECTKCHKPASTYKRGDNDWPGLISDMAMRAHISDRQKGAIYLYVMSVRHAVSEQGK